MTQESLETGQEIEIEQEAHPVLIVGWVTLFFDCELWIFMPDEFRVGQYFVTAAVIIGAVIGLTCVGTGLRRRKRMQRLTTHHHPGAHAH